MTSNITRTLLAAFTLGLALTFGTGAFAQSKTAIFAGGCFWCVEADFDHVPGVTKTVSGYTGGTVANPTYKQVVQGGTGHLEAVQVTYDASRVSYEELLNVFWHSVDPTDGGGQFCDRGQSYTTAIFVNNVEERQMAEASKASVASDLKVNASIVTPIRDAGPFYAAEAYHQGYYMSEEKLPLSRFGAFVSKKVAYKGYREGCGRDVRLQRVWGDTALEGTVNYK